MASYNGTIHSLSGGETSSIATTARDRDAFGDMVMYFVVGGLMSLLFELIIGHFIEVLKIAKQTSSSDSYLSIARRLTKEKGLVGIYDGFFPWGAIQAISKGAVFSSAHSFAKSFLAALVLKSYLSRGLAEIIAGGFGGWFQGIVLSPILLLKTRIITDPHFRGKLSFIQTIAQSAKVGVDVVKHEGIGSNGLMKGAGVYSSKRVVDWTTRFYFSVLMENLLYRRGEGGKTRKLTVQQKLLSSGTGGLISCFVTTPLDVLVAQIQQASNAKSDGSEGEGSVWSSFYNNYKEGGFEGLFGYATKGLVARSMHVALSTALLKTGIRAVYETYKEWKKANADKTAEAEVAAAATGEEKPSPSAVAAAATAELKASSRQISVKAQPPRHSK